MNAFAALKTHDDVEEEKDILGGGFQPFDSDVYDFTIKQAYFGESSGGAISVSLELETDEGRTLRKTEYVTSGTAKGQKNFYVNQKGEKHYLPGFITINHMALLTAGKELGDLETEEKVINKYDPDAGKEVPTKVNMLMDMVGQRIKLGILRQIVDKKVKDGNGNYVPDGTTREVNEIDKVFRESNGMTVVEIKAEADEAAFLERWISKNQGNTQDRTDKKAAAKASNGTSNSGNADGNAKVNKLFGKG